MKILNDLVLLGVSLKWIKEEKDRLLKECNATLEPASDAELPKEVKPTETAPAQRRRRRITTGQEPEISSIGSYESSTLLLEKSASSETASQLFKQRKSLILASMTPLHRRLALVRTRNKLMKKNLERLHQRRQVYTNEKQLVKSTIAKKITNQVSL